MDVEYLGPTRYDYDTSDSDEASAAPSPTPLSYVIRLKPTFHSNTDTLVISLLPSTRVGEQIGVIYAPAAPPKQMPIFGGMQTNNALARVFWADGCVQIAATQVPVELQFGWIQAVAQRLSPQRIVVVDKDEADVTGMNEFRSPAVLASAIVVGLPAAVLNYAEAFKIPCRHVRVGAHLGVELGRESVDALFDSQQSPHTAEYPAALHHDVSASLYV
ncbi:hypothetical protein IWW50_005840 [Coemansia erecta]|nr:hypothetical protein GGF43_005381 [Coemansia sp. RSA 2618]KAJ2818377.1 hypothetical protein IWW50_005840 [Coemansia erecta]